MNKIIQKVSTAILTSSILLAASVASASNAEDQYFYVGTEFGISDPVVKKFRHKKTKTRISLNRSKMYGGRIGYSFYPGMMIELSFTHQPKYGVKYILPRLDLAPNLYIPETPGKTKMKSNILMLNLIYELQNLSKGIRPYVIFGAGVAQISIDPTSSSTNKLPTSHPDTHDIIFKVRKNKMNCFASQFGVGLTRDLGNNFDIDFGVKAQLIKDIKIKYDKLDKDTGKLVTPKPIKKSVLMGEFTVGLTYKIPVK